MPHYRYHIFSCVNERSPDDPRGSCAARGAVELQELFKKEVFERGLKKVARANKSGCLDLCAKGPVVVIYPEGVWYAIRTREDVLEIIEKHLERGERVQRLIVKE